MTFLLCDIQQATFAKINLKNLEQIATRSKLSNRKAKDFVKASGLEKSIGHHDGITHINIPSTIGNRLDPDLKINTQFTPLNQSTKKNFNNDIEKIADGVEGERRNKIINTLRDIEEMQLYNIGRAIRKRKLDDVDKIMITSGMGNSFKEINKGRKPTQEDVKNIKQNLKKFKGDAKRLPSKTKGSKPPQPTIEEKKQNLKQKYGIR